MIRLSSNCKINIGLDVINRRSDGYHNLESLFYPVYGLYDEISITKRGDGDLVFSQEGIIVDCLNENNLCVRAYELLRSLYGIGGAEIKIKKNIPFGAGLGGGSSNASTVLKAANELYGIGLTEPELLALAMELGSDTAFFIHNRPCIVEGRGDILTGSDVSLAGFFLTLVKPSFSIGTAEAYRGVNPSVPAYHIKDVIKKDVREWRHYLKNDFEEHLFKDYPQLEETKNILYSQGAVLAMMSGSGSTMYALSERPLDLFGVFNNMFIFSELIK